MTDQEIKDAVSNVDGIGGMTVNERLYVTGLMDEFDNARINDNDNARRILGLLGVDNPSKDMIVPL